MTKKTFGSRNMPVARRVMAVRTYHHFRGNCDWAAIYWEAGYNVQGDSALNHSKNNLRTFQKYTEGHAYLIEYAHNVYDRWRRMANRDNWVAMQIDRLKEAQWSE